MTRAELIKMMDELYVGDATEIVIGDDCAGRYEVDSVSLVSAYETKKKPDGEAYVPVIRVCISSKELSSSRSRWD